MIIDQLKNWHLYAALPQLRRGFELLASPAAATWPNGRVELEGDRIFALPQGYQTRSPMEGRWEAHRKYIDIQYIVAGREAMGYAPLERLRPTGPFDEQKDVGFFDGIGNFVTVEAGMFAVFFPQDGHMPCIRVTSAAEAVRKIVMKVAVGM